MMKRTAQILMLAFVLIAINSFGRGVNTKLKEPPLSAQQPKLFIENKQAVSYDNQTKANDVKYYCDYPGATIYFKEKAITYVLYDSKSNKAQRVDITFENSQNQAILSASQPTNAYVNNYTSGQKQNLQANTFQKLTYTNIYPNIDLVYQIKDNQVKYDFVVKPGGKLNSIQMKVNGANSIKGTAQTLNIATAVGQIKESIPESYYLNAAGQKLKTNVNYNIKGNTISFTTQSQKTNATLVIDPVLNFFTPFTPALVNIGGANAVSVGNVVKKSHNITGGYTVAGLSNSLLIPSTIGPYQYTPIPNDYRAFLYTYNASDVLVWCTTIQGSGSTLISDISEANYLLMVCGETNNGNLPVALNTYQGGTDGWIGELDPSNGQLKYTYYIGGSGNDGATCISNGSHYIDEYVVGGYTSSSALSSISSTSPIKGNNYNGNKDGFIFNFRPMFTSLSFTAIKYYYIGSGADDEVSSLDFRSNLNLTLTNPSMAKLLVTGTTTGIGSAFLPAISSSLSSNAAAGDKDVFALSYNLSSATSTFSYACGTFIGTDANDEFSPRVDLKNDLPTQTYINDKVYLSFVTESSGLSSLTTTDAYQSTISSGGLSNFVLVSNYTLNSIQYASYFKKGTILPTTSLRLPMGIKVDAFDNIYVYGTTGDPSFAPSIDITPGGKPAPGTPASNLIDAFLAQFKPNYAFGYSTLFGSNDNEYTNQLDIIDMSSVSSICEPRIYTTGRHYNSSTAKAFISKITETEVLNISATNNNTIPSTLSIVNNLSNFSITNITWYFNGEVIQSKNKAVSSTGLFGNIAGDYYAIITLSNGCVLQTNTISLSNGCEDGDGFKDLTDEVNNAINSGTSSLVFTNRKLKLTSDVTLPPGFTLTLNNCLVLAEPCTRIEVGDKASLYLYQSALTACRDWRGIYVRNSGISSPPLLSVIETGISQAEAGIQVLAKNFSNDYIYIENSNFYYNINHLAIAQENKRLGNITGAIQYNNFLNLDIEREYCGHFSFENTFLKKHVDVLLDWVNIPSMDRNYFWNKHATLKATAILGANIGLTNDQNVFKGEYKSAYEIFNSKPFSISNDKIIALIDEYGIHLQGDIGGANQGSLVKDCHVENTTAGAIAGISVTNFDGDDQIANNQVYNFTNGIEFFNPNAIPNGANVNWIKYNSIYDALQNGIVVSYVQDPSGFSSANSSYTHTMYVNIQCNTINNTPIGLLGYGNMSNQVQQYNTAGTPITEEDAGNTFNCSNWDIIWGNNGTPGFTYYTPVAYTPNTSGSLAKLNVTIEGITYGVSGNDFLTQNYYTGSPVEIGTADCRVSHLVSTGVKNSTEAKENNNTNVYPNPFNEGFTITINNATTDKVEVYDVLGKLVYSNAVNNKQSLYIESQNWPSGLYLVKTYAAGKTLSAQKIIKTN